VQLDEVALKYECLFLVARRQHFNVGNLLDHFPQPRSISVLTVKIRTDPVAQVDCFADVKDATLPVLEQVNAWSFRERSKFLSQHRFPFQHGLKRPLGSQVLSSLGILPLLPVISRRSVFAEEIFAGKGQGTWGKGYGTFDGKFLQHRIHSAAIQTAQYLPHRNFSVSQNANLKTTTRHLLFVASPTCPFADLTISPLFYGDC
jgi:hypothetical protein